MTEREAPRRLPFYLASLQSGQRLSLGKYSDPASSSPNKLSEVPFPVRIIRLSMIPEALVNDAPRVRSPPNSSS
jgi:hypothetical protein